MEIGAAGRRAAETVSREMARGAERAMARRESIVSNAGVMELDYFEMKECDGK